MIAEELERRRLAEEEEARKEEEEIMRRLREERVAEGRRGKLFITRCMFCEESDCLQSL